MSRFAALSGLGCDMSSTEANIASWPPADPLALDPFSPIAPRPPRFAATLAPADPLALEPLGPGLPPPDDR